MNVPDVMRLASKTLHADEVAVMNEIKTLGNELHLKIENLGGSREVSLAKTKLEEAVMWAVKHITK